MLDGCSRIVESFGNSWGPAGWIAFVSWFILPTFLVGNNVQIAVVVMFAALAVWILWWIVDALDQQVAWWQGIAAVFMVGLMFVPGTLYGQFLAVAAWILYWTKVRE